MHYQYRLVKETLYHPEIGHFETAGIEVTYTDLENIRRTDFHSDVSVDFEDVQLLVDLMNKIQLRPDMLHKVIEDVFLS